MALAALCREDTPEYPARPAARELRRALLAVRRVFPGARLREVRPVRSAPTRPKRVPAAKLGGHSPMW